MRRLALAFALACVLSGAAAAGEIPSGDRAPQGPCTVTTTGGTPGTCTTAPQDSTTLLTIVLTLIDTIVP